MDEKQAPLSLEDQAKELHERLWAQAERIQGPALMAWASIGVLQGLLVAKGLLTVSEAEQLVKNSKRIYELLIDVEVSKVLSDDEFAERQKISQEPRELVMKMCAAAAAEIQHMRKSRDSSAAPEDVGPQKDELTE